METKLENLYRISQYARLVGVSDECVRLWVKQGKVKTITISNTIFVIKEDEV